MKMRFKPTTNLKINLRLIYSPVTAHPLLAVTFPHKTTPCMNRRLYQNGPKWTRTTDLTLIRGAL